jgi:hypothetical protein
MRKKLQSVVVAGIVAVMVAGVYAFLLIGGAKLGAMAMNRILGPEPVLVVVAEDVIQQRNLAYAEAFSAQRDSIGEAALEMSVGSKAIILEDQWVTAANKVVVYYDDNHRVYRELKKGDSCHILQGGILKVVKKEEKDILLEYQSAERYPLGSPCPSGVWFWAFGM